MFIIKIRGLIDLFVFEKLLFIVKPPSNTKVSTNVILQILACGNHIIFTRYCSFPVVPPAKPNAVREM